MDLVRVTEQAPKISFLGIFAYSREKEPQFHFDCTGLGTEDMHAPVRTWNLHDVSAPSQAYIMSSVNFAAASRKFTRAWQRLDLS